MTYELADDFDTRMKVQEILKSKYPEFSTLPGMSLMRISYKVSNMRNSVFKGFLANEIAKHVFNIMADEKLGIKAKVFVYWSKLSHQLPLTDYTQKLQVLLKDIRGQIENYDQNIILSLLNGLTYFDDNYLTNETLKEICDILSMTIKHRVDSIRFEFVTKVINYLNEIEGEKSVTNEHLQVWIDYLISAIPSERGFSIVPIFKLMKRHRYEDKAQIEKLYNIILEKQNISRLQADENTDAFRTTVKFVLGQSALDALHNTLIEDLKNKTENDNYRNVIYNLQKAVMFSQGTNEVADKIYQNLANLVNAADFQFPKLRPLLAEVTKNGGQYLRTYRDNTTDLILNKICSNLEELVNWHPMQKLVMLMFVIELPLHNPEQFDKFKNIKQAILKDIDTQSRFLNLVINELQDEKMKLNKNIHNRLHTTIREFVNNKEYIEKNDKKLLQQLLMINYYFSIQSRKDVEVENDSFVKLADSLKENNPELKVTMQAGKLIRLVKHFDNLNIESKALNLELVELLRNGITNQNDQIICLSKLIKLSVQDKKEIFHKYINEENVIEKFNTINMISTKCRFYTLITNANKEKLISDEKIKELQNQMLEIVKNQNEKPPLRIEAAVAMTHAKSEIIRSLDTKELSAILKDLFSGLNSTKRLTRLLDNLISRDEITMAILSNVAAVYIKEQNVDKVQMLKLLDLFSKFKWRSTHFYNKVISDYEEVFEKCNSSDHAMLVSSFARINLKKEDVIKAAVKNIKLNFFDSRRKVILFNDLVLLGFHDQEWKDLILDKIIAEIDIFLRNPINLSLKTLTSLWILQDWPKNKDDIVNFTLF
jgi:hypothetical protein